MNNKTFTHWHRHGWARAHPTSARVGREFAQIGRDFLRSRVGGSRLLTSLKLHRISSMNTSQKCVCPLPIVCAYLGASGVAC